MFEENKNLVTEEVTENVEDTTEQTEGVTEPEKIYSEDDLNKRVDELLAKKIARKEAKIRKEYDRKYGKLESVLKAGTGEDDIEVLTNTFTDFYAKKGITIPNEPTYSDRDMKVLAKAEADDIISSGYDEVVEEVDRLAEIGVDNMTAREKEVFKKLAEYRQNEESKKELASIGITDKDLNDNDYIEFKKNLNPSMSEKDKYEMYTKYRPKPKVEPIGSMKGTVSKETGVKDFYTREEALQFTTKDFDKNPELYKAIEKSMLKW